MILPTDTVYGLCADAYREAPVRRPVPIEEAPGRTCRWRCSRRTSRSSSTRSLSFADAQQCWPEPSFRARSRSSCRIPAAASAGSAGRDPESIGIRVPELPDESRAVLERVGAVAATSANLHGGRDPARPADVPEELRECRRRARRRGRATRDALDGRRPDGASAARAARGGRPGRGCARCDRASCERIDGQGSEDGGHPLERGLRLQRERQREPDGERRQYERRGCERCHPAQAEAPAQIPYSRASGMRTIPASRVRRRPWRGSIVLL